MCIIFKTKVEGFALLFLKVDLAPPFLKVDWIRCLTILYYWPTSYDVHFVLAYYLQTVTP